MHLTRITGISVRGKVKGMGNEGILTPNETDDVDVDRDEHNNWK